MPEQNIIKPLKKGKLMYGIRNSTKDPEYENSVQKIATETFRPFADQRGGKACLTGETVGIHNKYFLNLPIEIYRYIEP
jgi:hypothetical protein